MSPGDLPKHEAPDRPTIPAWVVQCGIAYSLAIVALLAVFVVALEDRHQLLYLGVAVALSFGTWIVVTLRSSLTRGAWAGCGVSILCLIAVVVARNMRGSP
jgi:hypothetical protein